MGGDLAVTSTQGIGSSFRVRLMLSESAQEQAPEDPSDDVAGYRGMRLQIMVADDDPVHRSLIEDLLTPLGFAITCTQDGPNCIERARSLRPDLFLIDLAMPGMDGWELATQLRAEGHTRTPIVIVSANAGQLQRDWPDGENPHDAVIAKPISVPLLLGTIGRLLRIDWLTNLPEIEPPTALPPEHSLTERHLADLRQLGAIGYVRGIQARLDELATELPQAHGFITHLRALISEFRLADFMAELDRAEAKAKSL